MLVVAACGGTADRPTHTADTLPSVSAASAKWAEFSDHFVASANESSTIVAERAAIDRTDADAMDALDANAQKLQRWADGETEWLDGHPSDPCYAGSYASWTRHVALFGQIARLIREAIAKRDMAKMDKAVEMWREDDGEMQKMIDSVGISDDACGT